MYIHEFREVLFRRQIKDPVKSDIEEEMRPAIIIVVTKEANGYAVWYSYEHSRIIAFSLNRDEAIKYAALVNPEEAEQYAMEAACNYNLRPIGLAEIK